MSGQVLGIVPARLASTRLPDKPLYPILGKPLIEWVWRRVSSMSVLDHAVVATDSAEVADVCRRLGAPVEMTSVEHPSGTDRVAEVADRPKYRDYTYIANVQGDEPLLKEAHLRSAIDLVRDSGWQVGTCATPLMTEEARADSTVVKVARAASGRALYFSRAPIPYKRDEKPVSDELAREPYLRHIGIYAYTREALHDWVALAPSQLERLELLEQLRPLEAGLRIGVSVVGAADPGVDTPARRAPHGGRTVPNDTSPLSRVTDPMTDSNTRRTKYIFVTGGVVSSLGKGIAAASIGRLLKERGLRVTLQKFDPYINVDPGTLSPFQHGEVFRNRRRGGDRSRPRPLRALPRPVALAGQQHHDRPDLPDGHHEGAQGRLPGLHGPGHPPHHG